MRRIRVLIADDHNLFARALEAILGTDERFEIVALAQDGKQAVEFVDSLEPDIVLMDIAMPVLDGFSATKQLHSTHPDLPVLMLTGSNSRGDVDKARTSGAAGYVTKDRIAGELIDAIVEAVEKP